VKWFLVLAGSNQIRKIHPPIKQVKKEGCGRWSVLM